MNHPFSKDSNMTDPTEEIRHQHLAEINADPDSREALQAKHGQVYSTEELAEHFEVVGFQAPYVVVRRRSDGALGSLAFQHAPRYYFNFQPHNK